MEKCKSIKDVFDKVFVNQKCKNKTELMKELKMSRDFFYQVQSGKKHLSEEKALIIASKAGLTDESMLILLAREKAHSDEARAVWDRIILNKECRIMDIM